MDCALKQKPLPKRPRIILPKKFKVKYMKTIFEDTILRTHKEYGSETRKKTMRNLVKEFHPKKRSSTLATDTEIWDVEAIASSPPTSPRGNKAAKIYAKILTSTNRQIIHWPSKFLPRDSELFKEMSKIEQAALNIEKAAREFAEWWTDLGSNSTEEEKITNTETIKTMFSVEFDEHITRALAIITKEIMCVPKQIATVTCQPQASVSATLKRQTKCDAIAEAKEMRYSGFGKKLPLQLIFIPPDNQTRERWIDVQDLPKELDNMATVWNGITNLKSSKHFYRWLAKHPEKKMPPFMEYFYENESEESSICDARDLMESHDISKTLLPVLRSDENINEMRSKALADF